MSNDIRAGRIDGQTLAQYAKAHPNQTPQVAEAVRDAGLQIVDYVKYSLAGEKGYSPRAAFHMLDELRNGMVEVKRGPSSVLDDNKQRVEAKLADLNRDRAGVVGDRPVELADGREIKSDALQSPPGLGNVRLGDMGSRTTYVVQGSTVRESPEQADKGYASYDLGSRVQKAAQGVDGLVKQIEDASTILQPTLSNRALRQEEVAQYHEFDSSSTNVSQSSASSVEGERKLFGRGVVEGSQASDLEVTSSSQHRADFVVEPEMIQAFQVLKDLRNALEGLGSCPAQHLAIDATRKVSEDVAVQTTTTPEKKRFHRQEPADIQDKTLKAWSADSGNYEGSARRELGTVPYAPAYITVGG